MLVGESGYGRHGSKYTYYKCATRKRRGSKCNLKIVKKDILEHLVIEHTITYVLQDDVIEYITDRVLEIQAKSTINYTLQGLKNSMLMPGKPLIIS